MSLRENDEYMELIRDNKHEDDCDCSACVEKAIEDAHEWDYDIMKDNELSNG